MVIGGGWNGGTCSRPPPRVLRPAPHQVFVVRVLENLKMWVPHAPTLKLNVFVFDPTASSSIAVGEDLPSFAFTHTMKLSVPDGKDGRKCERKDDCMDEHADGPHRDEEDEQKDEDKGEDEANEQKDEDKGVDDASHTDVPPASPMLGASLPYGILPAPVLLHPLYRAPPVPHPLHPRGPCTRQPRHVWSPHVLTMRVAAEASRSLEDTAQLCVRT